MSENEFRDLIDSSQIEKLIQAIPTLPQAEAGDVLAFYRAASAYARKWARENVERLAEFNTPVVFVLSESVRNEAIPAAIKLHQLASDFTLDIKSSIVATSENMRIGLQAQFNCSSAQEVFSRVVDLGLGARACVVFHPHTRTIVLCNDGIEGEHSYNYSLDQQIGKDYSRDELSAILAMFHEKFTQSPQGVSRVWDHPERRIIFNKAETRIQADLLYYLQEVVFQTQFVIAEHSTVLGRVDIHIMPGVLGPTLGSCVIELKVLKSRFPPDGVSTFSPRENKQHAFAGMIQAIAYRRATQAQEAFLCCFDARDDDADIPDIQLQCEKRNVHYRRYYMFSKLVDAQEEAASAP